MNLCRFGRTGLPATAVNLNFSEPKPAPFALNSLHHRISPLSPRDSLYPEAAGAPSGGPSLLLLLIIVILTALLMVTRITGLGISFSQFSDVLRSSWRGGGYSQPRCPVNSANRTGKGRFPEASGHCGTPVPAYHPLIPGAPFLCPPPAPSLFLHPTPIPFVSFSDGCFQSQVFFFSSAQNPEIKGRSQAGPGGSGFPRLCAIRQPR